MSRNKTFVRAPLNGKYHNLGNPCQTFFALALALALTERLVFEIFYLEKVGQGHGVLIS